MASDNLVFSLPLLFLLTCSVSSQWIGSPQLDCRRVHPSFCCTSRIRSLCPRECSAVQCGPEYYQRMFSTDLNGGSVARDENMERRVQEERVEEEEREITVVDATPSPFFASSPSSRLPVTSRPPFPTLIPFEPNIDEVLTQEKISSRAKPPKPFEAIKRNRTPDPRIIRPPDASLVLIGDYEDGETIEGATPLVSNSGAVAAPSPFIAKEEFLKGGGTILSRTPGNFEKKGSFVINGAVDGVAGRNRDIANGISALLKQIKMTETKTGLQNGSASVGRIPVFLPTRPPAPPPPPRTQSSWQTTSPSPPPPSTPTPWQLTPPTPSPWQQTPAPWVQPSPPPPQCGVAPQFTPCVSSQVASAKLLKCCLQKSLPPGCQALCRYDITQAEVRAAMDRGQCGLLHVAPFLECAAQGHDNSQCCSMRGVAQKTGPQCLQFCHPNMGLTALGLQHIVCGNAIGDMLYCHHSGIRP